MRRFVLFISFVFVIFGLAFSVASGGLVGLSLGKKLLTVPSLAATVNTAGLQITAPNVASGKVAWLTPQPNPPPEDLHDGLTVRWVAFPSVYSRGNIAPKTLELVYDEANNSSFFAPGWSRTDYQPACWYMVNRTSDKSIGQKNIVVWCHRLAPVNFDNLDLAKLKPDDPVWIWAEDSGGNFYALEARVRWLGLVPREYEPDFWSATDGWVVTLITCSIEPGLPDDPKNRVIIRATFNEATNYAALHYVGRGEVLSRLAKTYGSTVDVLKNANGLANANLIKEGQPLWIPLLLKPFSENQ